MEKAREKQPRCFQLCFPGWQLLLLVAGWGLSSPRKEQPPVDQQEVKTHPVFRGNSSVAKAGTGTAERERFELLGAAPGP